MNRKPSSEPWSVEPVSFGRSLTGLGVNLLVADMARSIAFAGDILGVEILYWNEDFAALRSDGAGWMLHSDQTYRNNAYLGIAKAADGTSGRGAGAELHLYNSHPDAVEARARASEGDHHLLAGCLNKPHGLRECYILDPDGYCWVVNRPLRDEELL